MVRIRGNLDDIKPDGFHIPPGRYLAKLINVKEDNSKSTGQPMYVWHWQIVEGEHQGAEILSFTSLQSGGGRALVNHLAAFGLKGKVDVDLSTLIGRKAVLVVGTRKVARGQYEDDLPTVVAVLPEEAWNPKEKK